MHKLTYSYSYSVFPLSYWLEISKSVGRDFSFFLIVKFTANIECTFIALFAVCICTVIYSTFFIKELH